MSCQRRVFSLIGLCFVMWLSFGVLFALPASAQNQTAQDSTVQDSTVQDPTAQSAVGSAKAAQTGRSQASSTSLQKSGQENLQPPALPDAWADVVEEAPVTAEAFQHMTLADTLASLWDMLCAQMLAPLRLLAKLCGVLVLAATAKCLINSASSETAALLDTIVTLGIFAVCSPVILGLMGVIESAVEQSRTYLACFVPVFASVLITCGQMGASAVYSGFFFAFSSLMANVLCGVALPLTRVFLALNAAGAVSSTLDLSRITSGISRWMKWLLSFFSTVFAMVIGLQSVLAQSADSFALKTGKLLVGTSVPVVGRAVSDAMSGVFAGLKLIKGTVGFAAVAAIAAAFVPVLLECLVYHLVFSAGALVASATDSPKAAQIFDGFAQCISLFIAMTFFFCTVVISATVLMIVVGSGG